MGCALYRQLKLTNLGQAVFIILFYGKFQCIKNLFIKGKTLCRIFDAGLLMSGEVHACGGESRIGMQEFFKQQ
jgi:hypothetical protein